MKKITFSLCMLTIFSVSSFAQLINHDFVFNNGNDGAPIYCGQTFIPGSAGLGPGSLQGWYRSHGTATIINNCQGRPDAVKLVGQNLSLGQGIAQEYHFENGKTYKICFRLLNWETANGDLKFVIAKSLQQDLPPSSYCVTTASYIWLPASDIQTLTDPAPGNTSSQNCQEVFDGAFTFTAEDDFDFLYVSFRSSKSDDVVYFVELEYVNVVPDCSLQGSLVFDDGTAGPIAPGAYDTYTGILAGSSLGASTTPVKTSPSGNTLFKAKNYVMLVDNFEATVNSNQFFEAMVDPELCSYNCEGMPSSKPGKRNETYGKQYSNFQPAQSIDDLAKNISIYPNPTTGAFNIEVPQRGNYTLRVMNMMGSTVYEGKMTERRRSIQLDNDLPPGNYNLHISGDGLRHVERITLTK